MSLASLGRTNVNSVIASLLKMGNAQRQQFAQSHEDDPLMLSAAKFVDNKIKEQAQAYLAQQSGAAPPKINEQVIQAMGPQAPPQPQGQPQGQPQPQAAQTLPENSGIAQLPAPNMQGMAGGGIVAFSGEAESLVRSHTGGKDYFLDIPATIPDPSVPYYREIPNPKADLANRKFGSRAEAVLAYDTGGSPSGGPHPRLAQSTDPLASVPTQTTLPPTGTGAGQGTRGAPAPKVVSADVLAERLAAKQKPATSAAQATNQGPQGLAALQQSLMPTGSGVDPYADTHAAMASREAVQGELEKADALQRQAGLASIIAPREARIKGREDRIQSAEDLSTKMSIINAGLAMMQSTGKGLSGIAEGAAVGTKQYAEGKKASELARQKMEDARDAFDEFKYNAGNMAQKDVTAAKRAIVAGANAADQMGITAKAADLTRKYENANKLFTATAAQQEGDRDRASRERTAAISAQVQKEIAQMPGAAERMYATFGGGDAKKGFEYFTAATAEGKGNEAIIQAVIKTPELLGAVSPKLREVIEAEIMSRFPQVQNKPGSRP